MRGLSAPALRQLGRFLESPDYIWLDTPGENTCELIARRLVIRTPILKRSAVFTVTDLGRIVFFACRSLPPATS